VTHLHEIGIAVFTFASVLSLLFLLAKSLAKEFEAVALVWIRMFRRLKLELAKPVESGPERLIKQSNSGIKLPPSH
jgi:hypothetical protein